MSAYAVFPVADALDASADTLESLGLSVTWGIEVLMPTGWRPVLNKHGQPVLCRDKDEATRAAVKTWRRTDRAARPAMAVLGHASS